MRSKADHILEFKVTLKGVKPPIWRRFQLSCTATFWDLHCALQDAMGWHDCHLHEFWVRHPLLRDEVRIGVPDDDWGDPDVLAGWDVLVADYLTMTNRSLVYAYDFGDGWEHRVQLEKILPRPKNLELPRLVSGRGACPPENCGGAHGYQTLRASLDDPAHPDHDWACETVPEDWRPLFDEVGTVFRDPEAARAAMFV